MTSRFAVVGLGTLLLVGLGCGSSSGTSGLDRTQAISTLSDSQRALFCDELAGIEGGYSKQKTVTCDGGATEMRSFTIGADQTECKARFMTQLPAGCASETVGDLEGCVTAIYASNSCGLNPLTDLPACNNWIACNTGD